MSDTQHTPVPPHVFTVDDVAALFCCVATTVREHAKSGNLPGLKFGVDWVFPAVALLARINELATEEGERRRRGKGRTGGLAVAHAVVPATPGRRGRLLPVLPALLTIPPGGPDKA